MTIAAAAHVVYSPLDLWLTLGAYAVAVGGIATVYLQLRRAMIRTITAEVARLTDERILRLIAEQIAPIQAEIVNHGGVSMRDRLTRLEAGTAAIQARQDAADRAAAGMAGELDRLRDRFISYLENLAADTPRRER